MESYEVSLVTINRQTSYDSGILRQDNRIIRGLPMNYTKFVDWVTIWVVHLLERTKPEWPYYLTRPDCAGRA